MSLHKSINNIYLNNHIKVKISPLQAMKVTGDVDARVHIYTATAVGRGKVSGPRLGWYSFYRRLSGFQKQSGHKGVKKNLYPSDTRD